MMTDDEARRRVDRWRRQFDAVASGHGHLREWERADAEAMVRACETVVSLRAERDALRAEVEMLRGVGCDEFDGTEVRGPCGACLKCARRERDEARRLLAAAARGELPRCVTCGDLLALRQWEGTPDAVCDVCYVEGEDEVLATGESYDPAGCVDLPYAAALRAAIGGGR